jgi:hypothetical protein
VPLHDPVSDGQPKARPGLFSREEGLEELVFDLVGNAWSSILDAYLNLVRLRIQACRGPDLAAVRHRFGSVQDYVKHNLAHLVPVGFKSFDAHKVPEYGYGKYKNVLTGMDFEKMNSASGSTGGRILLANGQEPKSVGIIHCVGSRDARSRFSSHRRLQLHPLQLLQLLPEPYLSH